jgi:CRP-like cAMP-binding protein
MGNNAENVSLLNMPELAELIASTRLVERAAGETLFQSGELCTTLPLLISGDARIYATDKNGQQVTLYYLKPGAVCPISLSILLQNSTYPASAIADTATLIRYLPGEAFTAALNSRPEIFRMLLDTFASGLNDSARIARQLLMSDPNDNPVNTSATERAAQR